MEGVQSLLARGHVQRFYIHQVALLGPGWKATEAKS